MFCTTTILFVVLGTKIQTVVGRMRTRARVCVHVVLFYFLFHFFNSMHKGVSATDAAFATLARVTACDIRASVTIDTYYYILGLPKRGNRSKSLEFPMDSKRKIVIILY